MTQADRDRLVTLKKAKKRLITQREAAEELKLSIRQVKRLLYALKKNGDKAVVHGLKGRPSNRRIEQSKEKQAVKILSADVYRGFGPTLAAEYLHNKHQIDASKETVRQWMIRSKLWRAKKEKVTQVHVWRPRRSRFGELVQWDTSEHDWLEGRGEKLYLIAMIDDATSRFLARFVRHDSTAENMKLLWSYLEKFGRPLTFYTDKASLFQTAEKQKRDEPGVLKDAVEMPPTQIGRALQELRITWIAAHSPQALPGWGHFYFALTLSTKEMTIGHCLFIIVFVSSWQPGGLFGKLFDLSGKVALVTGAAAGFGEVICEGFAQFGCDIAAADLDYDGAKRMAAKVSSLGRRSVAIPVDVGNPEQIQSMIRAVVDALGTIDILVNCAGIPQHDAAESTPLETWDRVIDINLRGTFLCCQAAAQVMLEKKQGVIINFSSIAGAVGIGRGANVYCASKGGVNTLTKALALEWASRGVRVNAIAPCQFMTPGLREVIRDPQFDPKKLMETWTANIPLGRVGESEEIVGPALFLASNASSMVTGTILDVDGGYLAR